MATPILPDVARLVSAYLRSRDEVVELVEQRVYTAFPKQLEGKPFALVQRVGGFPPISRPLVVDAAAIQLDAYGGRQAEALELVETCRHVLVELAGEQPDGTGNVCGVIFGPLRYLPDETWKPPRPRYIADLEVTVKTSATVLAGAA